MQLFVGALAALIATASAQFKVPPECEVGPCSGVEGAAVCCTSDILNHCVNGVWSVTICDSGGCSEPKAGQYKCESQQGVEIGFTAFPFQY
jgi:hypothetical protein